MAQHDMNIANQGFPATRADLNNALQALATNNSGTSAPSTTFANQWWYDTTNNNLYIRNEANNAWILIASLDQTNNEWEIVTGVIQAKDSDGLALKTDDGTTRIFIKDSNGNIGIHNTTCSASLHVSEASSGLTARFSNEVNQTLDLGTVSGVNAGGSVYFDNANSGNILFRSGGNERMRMLAAGGLTFNGDTAAANALSDYEEGSWTPTLFSGSDQMTTTNPVGIYVKVGKHITVQGSLTRNDSSSFSGFLEVGGLPFARGTIAYLVPTAPGWGWIDNGTGSDITALTYLNSSNNLRFVLDYRVDNSRYFIASDITNGRPIYFSATYRTT